MLRAFIVLSLLWPGLARATSCATPDELWFTHSELVFIGRLISGVADGGNTCRQVYATDLVMKGVARDRITVLFALHSFDARDKVVATDAMCSEFFRRQYG